ncbi:MAG: ABC transporter substrate-binding protein [Epulopiscium sp. Nele67-Bin005]|nr:MAG: ABC transporter substrate-binding protein [Epulopiscium sp. Nele67-Bin005]
MKFSKLLGAVLTGTMLVTTVGCGSDNSSSSGGDEIYFLNFKPEISQVYERIAKDYEAETGVRVKVETAASGTYETTLKSEISKSFPPTIYQINGPVGYESWKNYTADLKDTQLYELLTDKSLAVTDGEGVYGIPYVVEGYGIIYNDKIMRDYFALPNKKVSISSADEITNFETLKAVVEDMTDNLEALGISGVFASTSLGSGEQWRWQTHLANTPFYHEFLDYDGVENPILAGLEMDEIEFTYNENFRNLFDLYINNSVTKPGLLGSKSVTDSMAEFALGRVAMVQNGSWAWAQIDEVGGNIVKADDIKFMPLYMGIEGEENYGLSIGTENYFSINSQASQEQQDMAVDFLEWLFTSEIGKYYVLNELNLVAPFASFDETERPSDPLAKEIIRWLEKDVESVPWAFITFPSEHFKNRVGDALLTYAQGQTEWNEVVAVTVDAWKTEVSLKK